MMHVADSRAHTDASHATLRIQHWVGRWRIPASDDRELLQNLLQGLVVVLADLRWLRVLFDPLRCAGTGNWDNSWHAWLLAVVQHPAECDLSRRYTLLLCKIPDCVR
jgi:hypothetical protein